MSQKKKEFLQALLEEHRPAHPYPKSAPDGLTLTEHAIYLVLMRFMTENQAEASLKAMRAKLPDWNEMRVSQTQEIAACFRTSSRKKGHELLNDYRPAALEVRLVLQEIFQQTHGLNLDEIREDVPDSAGKFVKMPRLGPGGAAYIMYLAGDGQFPMTPDLVKLLDRLGVIPKTTSVKKAEASLAPLIPAGKTLEVAVALHELAATWNDEESPAIDRYKSLQLLPAGKKAFDDRKVAVARAEAAAAKEAERERKRIEAEEKKAKAEQDRIDRKKELERERIKKKAEAEAAKEARKKAAEAKRKEAERKKVEAKKKREADAKKAAEAKKKAEAKAKADAKKAAEAKKKAEAKAKADAKKLEAKKAAEAKKKAAAAKAAAAKKAAKKVTKKPAAKKPAAKKAATKKPAAKKAPVKKDAPAKKVPAKKPAAKKAAKKTTKKAVKKTASKARVSTLVQSPRKTTRGGSVRTR